MNQVEMLSRAMGVQGTCVTREVAFLYRIALQAPLRHTMVELGTYLGRTLIALAAAAQERQAQVVSIDDYSYHESCSLSAVRQNLSDAGLLDGARLIDGDSRERPNDIRQVGLLFVDSHHVRAHFDAEMGAWLHTIVPNGIVACHDYRSGRWPEITGAVDHWLGDRRRWAPLGIERRLVAFRRIG